jgi:hypothetical protein
VSDNNSTIANNNNNGTHNIHKRKLIVDKENISRIVNVHNDKDNENIVDNNNSHNNQDSNNNNNNNTNSSSNETCNNDNINLEHRWRSNAIKLKRFNSSTRKDIIDMKEGIDDMKTPIALTDELLEEVTTKTHQIAQHSMPNNPGASSIERNIREVLSTFVGFNPPPRITTVSNEQEPLPQTVQLPPPLNSPRKRKRHQEQESHQALPLHKSKRVKGRASPGTSVARSGQG